MKYDYRRRLYKRYVSSHVATDGRTLMQGRTHYLKKVVRDHFPEDKNASILELGCGHGALLYFANLAGYSAVEGIDISEEQVNAARQLGITSVRQGDILKEIEGRADESLDMVIAFDVIEHLTKDELLDFVDQVRRVLKHGGCWLLHTPNASSPFFGRVRYGDYTHEQAFTRSSLSQLLQISGFSSVTCYEDAPIVHGIKSFVRFIMWRLSTGLMKLVLLAETGSADEILSQNLFVVAIK